MWPFGRSRGSGESAAPDTIDVREAYARAGKGARLIDVRSEREFAAGHPKGARNIPPSVLHNGGGDLRPDDEILLICASGHRSLREARRLASKGYPKVANVDGGLLAWQRAGLPVKAKKTK
jgi:rhodanese-related sulfurtransferase